MASDLTADAADGNSKMLEARQSLLLSTAKPLLTPAGRPVREAFTGNHLQG